MNKLLLVILSFFSLLTTSSVKPTNEEYYDQVTNAYESLAVVDATENQYFTFYAFRGICNDVGAFGVYLDSFNNELHLTFNDGENELFYKNKSGKDASDWIVASKLSKNITVTVVDSTGNVYHTCIIEVLDANYGWTLLGYNAGCKFTKLKKAFSFRDRSFIIPVTITLSLLIVAGLFFMFREQNRLNEEKKKKIIEQIKSMQSNMEQAEENDFFEEFENSEVISEEQVEEEKVYDSPRRDFDEEVEVDVLRVKELLKGKGHSTDYSSLTDEEKKVIMVDLMILKNSGEITEAEYNTEVIELWKN